MNTSSRQFPDSFPYVLGAFCALAGLLFPSEAIARQDKRPDVHSDFRFAMLPYETAVAEQFASEEARTMISAFHKGWNVEKLVKESGKPEVEVFTLLEDLERQRLVRGESDYDLRPGFPLLREKDLALALPVVKSVGEGIANVLDAHWDEVEAFLSTLETGGELDRGELLYRAVVGGVLLDRMVEVLYDDKTLMPGPPRRSRRGAGYYAWMTEGDAGPNQLVGQSAQVGRHRVFSIGREAVDEPRIEIRELNLTDPVFEYEDARRWRIFANAMSRDNLLPYLKSNRNELLDLHSSVEAARYTAFAEFFAWFYISAASEAADLLVERGRIDQPETTVRYALLSDR